MSATFGNIGFNPAVVSINGDKGNRERLQPGKANTVRFTLGAIFNGEGELKITGATKSQALPKASFAGGGEFIKVGIKDGEFTADIVPEKAEKTVSVALSIDGVEYVFPPFTVAGSAGAGTAAPVPTMSDFGLLLSGIALAGAAAPALRRREKQGKKPDTNR